MQKDPPDILAGYARMILKSFNLAIFFVLKLPHEFFKGLLYVFDELHQKDLDLAASYTVVNGVLQNLRWYIICTADTNGSWVGHGTYAPQKQFWLIALLGWYSIVSFVFPWAASFSNTVNTMEENEDNQTQKIAYY